MWPFDQNNQQLYQKYARAYDTGDYSSIDQNEAQGQVQQFLRNAPPQEVQHVFAEHFNKLDPGQRAQLVQQFPAEYHVNPNDPNSMAQGVARLQQEHPDLLQRLVAHPLLVAGAAGLAAIVAKHMLEHR